MSKRRAASRSWLSALAAAACLMLLAPAAEATVRYAEPGGDGPQPCAEANPCAIEDAIEDATVSEGDEIVLLPGDYDLGSDQIQMSGTGVTVRGALSQPRPRIISSHPSSAFGAFGTQHVLSDFEISYSGGGSGLSGNFRATVERLFVHATAPSATACGIDFETILRDSVCWAPGAAIQIAMGFGPQPDPIAVAATIRNVTAVGGGYGLEAAAGQAVAYEINVRNSILSGGVADVAAFTGAADATSAVDVNFSNYASVARDGVGTESVDAPGSAANQTDPPLFVNAPGGDFHQLPTSPTVNAGNAGVAGLGSADIDGETRVFGPTVDIGADEIQLDLAVDGARLQARRTQRQGKRIRVKAKAFAAEPVDLAGGGVIRLKGRSYPLKPVDRAAAAGERVRLALKPAKKAHRSKIARALRRGKKVRAKVIAGFTDAAANSATLKKTVRLKP